MAGRVLAIKGGRLIDGTGRPPIENSVILIEDGRFKAVGNAQSLPVPADAEVVDVSGKTVMPGFMDGHGHLEDFHGELYLHLGITSVFTIQTSQDGPWNLAQKRGTELGKIRGPRIFVAGRAIGGERDVPEGASDSQHHPRQHHRQDRRRGAQRGAEEEGARLRPDQAQRVSGFRLW